MTKTNKQQQQQKERQNIGRKKIQTPKTFKRTLFIRTKIQSANFRGRKKKSFKSNGLDMMKQLVCNIVIEPFVKAKKKVDSPYIVFHAEWLFPF